MVLPSPRWPPNFVYGITMTATRVSPKGQVTIPEPIRRRYGLQPGARVAWVERDGAVFPVALRGLTSLRGLLRGGRGTRSLRAALAEDRAAERAREDG